MKALFYLSLMLSFSACLSYKKGSNFAINTANIKQAQIEQFPYAPIILDKTQINNLCQNLNKNKVNGPTKYIKIYTIEFTLKKDSIITLYANNDIFSHEMNTYTLKSAAFLNAFWNEIGGNNTFQLFRPVSIIDEKLIQSSSQNVDNELLNNLQKVLSYYKIEHKILDNLLYYKGEITIEENYNYMLKAQDTAWLKSH